MFVEVFYHPSRFLSPRQGFLSPVKVFYHFVQFFRFLLEKPLKNPFLFLFLFFYVSKREEKLTKRFSHERLYILVINHYIQKI